MFKLQANPTFKAIVPITRLGEDAPGLIEFKFKNVGVKRFDALIEASRSTTKNDLELLSELIESWAPEDEEHGVDTPYSADALAALVDAFPSAVSDILIGYRMEMLGQRRKN